MNKQSISKVFKSILCVMIAVNIVACVSLQKPKMVSAPPAASASQEEKKNYYEKYKITNVTEENEPKAMLNNSEIKESMTPSGLPMSIDFQETKKQVDKYEKLKKQNNFWSNFTATTAIVSLSTLAVGGTMMGVAFLNSCIFGSCNAPGWIVPLYYSSFFLLGITALSIPTMVVGGIGSLITESKNKEGIKESSLNAYKAYNEELKAKLNIGAPAVSTTSTIPVTPVMP